MRPSAFSLTGPGRLQLYSTAELMALPPPEWLIHNIMPNRGLIGLYGQPGSGKSFLALDFAMSVASGTPWHGHNVHPGPVLYVAAEGGTGMGKRSAAWIHEHKITPAKGRLMWLLESIPIHGDSTEVDRVLDRIIDEVQVQPRLIVIDTLARCFDGDENKQEDMGRFVAGASLFCEEFDAAVIIVHHTRLDGDRERGNTAFRGAAETMLRLKKKDQNLTLTCSKQKDAEEFDEIEMVLKKVPSVESCVIGMTSSVTLQQKTDMLVDLLKANGSLSYSEWAQAATRLNIPSATFKRRLQSLKMNQEIIKENGKYRIFGSTV